MPMPMSVSMLMRYFEMIQENYGKLFRCKNSGTENRVSALFLEYSQAFKQYLHLISLKFKYQVRRWKTAWRFQIFLMATHLCLFIHDILYDHILYELHKKLLRVAQKRSSLIYKASARHERHDCNTSKMSATRVRHKQHKCDTSATRVLHERHECNTSATRTT